MKKLLFLLFIVLNILVSGCGPSVKYEKIQGLALLDFGNTMIVYSGGVNSYDLVFSDDGTYTKKKWSDKSIVSGTWTAAGNDLLMDETDGPNYTLTADAEGIVRDGMSVYINEESGSISGLFNELVGTGSGVLDVCFTDAIGKYKVELLGDVATVVLTFNDGNVNIKRNLLNGGFLEDNEYEWTCNGIDFLLTMVGSSDVDQDITKIDEKWWVEGIPINLYFLSDESYVGYMVVNIDYIGE